MLFCSPAGWVVFFCKGVWHTLDLRVGTVSACTAVTHASFHACVNISTGLWLKSDLGRPRLVMKTKTKEGEDDIKGYKKRRKNLAPSIPLRDLRQTIWILLSSLLTFLSLPLPLSQPGWLLCWNPSLWRQRQPQLWLLPGLNGLFDFHFSPKVEFCWVTMSILCQIRHSKIWMQPWLG